MGCDINMHFEILVNDEWLHYSQPDFGRNYQIFSKMAGVRGSEEPIASPRGFPEDANITTRLCYGEYGGDSHSPSFLNSSEIIELFKFIVAETQYEDGVFIGNSWGYLFGNSWESFHECRADYPEFLQDFRLVFWFDS